MDSRVPHHTEAGCPVQYDHLRIEHEWGSRRGHGPQPGDPAVHAQRRNSEADSLGAGGSTTPPPTLPVHTLDVARTLEAREAAADPLFRGDNKLGDVLRRQWEVDHHAALIGPPEVA